MRPLFSVLLHQTTNFRSPCVGSHIHFYKLIVLGLRSIPNPTDKACFGFWPPTVYDIDEVEHFHSFSAKHCIKNWTHFLIERTSKGSNQDPFFNWANELRVKPGAAPHWKQGRYKTTMEKIIIIICNFFFFYILKNLWPS